MNPTKSMQMYHWKTTKPFYYESYLIFTCLFATGALCYELPGEAG
jgi:hypothetical protein